MVSRSCFVPSDHCQMFAIDGIVDLCLAGMGFSGVLGVAQTGVGVSDGQIVRVQVPVSRQISAMKRCMNSKKLSNSFRFSLLLTCISHGSFLEMLSHLKIINNKVSKFCELVE